MSNLHRYWPPMWLKSMRVLSICHILWIPGSRQAASWAAASQIPGSWGWSCSGSSWRWSSYLILFRVGVEVDHDVDALALALHRFLQSFVLLKVSCIRGWIDGWMA